jgi:MFS family permease
VDDARSASTATSGSVTFAPLRVPEFRRIWGAAMVSHVGTFLQLTAGPWLMNEMTGSPLLVSLVTTALLLPRLLLTLPAGVLADVLDRRTLLLTGQSISALAVTAMAVLAATGLLDPVSLLALTFVLGVGSVLALPAFQTLVPDLVEAPLRAQAITLNSAAFNVARAFGPALGGALVAAGMASAAFGANAVSYLAVIGVLLTFPRAAVTGEPRPGLWRSAATGVRYARFTRSIRVLLAVAAVFALTSASLQALLPSVSSDDLGLGGMGYGVLYGLFGAGALLGAFTRERVRAPAGRLMLPGSIVLSGLGAAGFGLAPVVGLAGAAIAVAGLAWVWTLTTLNASVQILAPRWVRGRVVSLYVLAVGLQPVGAFLSGFVAEATGPGSAVAVFGVTTVLLGLATLRLGLPVLGRLEEPTAPEDWVAPEHARHVAGSPVLVLTTWEIDPEDVEEFFAVMRDLRRHRYRSGAHRWSLFRDADRPHRVTEIFAVHDWEEHLAQHRRLDAEMVQVLSRARAFDRADGPVTRHLAGLDVVDPTAPPFEEQLLTVHEQLHRSDGSVPLRQRPETGADGPDHSGQTRSARGPRPSLPDS